MTEPTPGGRAVIERCVDAADMSAENGWILGEAEKLVGAILTEFMTAICEPEMVERLWRRLLDIDEPQTERTIENVLAALARELGLPEPGEPT